MNQEIKAIASSKKSISEHWYTLNTLKLLPQKLYFGTWVLNPNKAGLFEGSFSWGVQFKSSLHVSRRTYLISI